MTHRLDEGTLRSRMAEAAANDGLRANVRRSVDRFVAHRAEALAAVDDPTGLREAARAARQRILADLPRLLDRLADRVLDTGGHVHWAPTAADARAAVVAIAQEVGARTIVKSKSMATEEIELNPAVEAAGMTVVETDLGEWIIQLARETPSHIIAPALHHNRHTIQAVFRDAAGAPDDLSTEPEALNRFARAKLRERFLAADVGITGANFAVASSGSVVLVTNEGNGRMVTTLPRVHIAVLGMERVVADFDDLDLLLQLLTRSATGQPLTSYTSILTGPRRDGEADGPDEFHLLILDNGRSAVLGTEFHEILGCIRCGACLNVCPVYRQTGGHAYGWVYPGPVGAVLTPLLAHDRAGAAEVANASTLCGACMEACPVQIPIQDLLLGLRRERAERDATAAEQAGWSAWAAAWSRPAGYRATTKAATWGRWLARHARLVPGASRWTAGRAAPVPAPRRFRDRWEDGDV